ncbi:hypothetical protein [Parolsenella catena]|jgi:hypothetical protein|uniref:hypothetical protein n=1 Tax=Parolsenella catena TaxID=2003188 RepID=UPI00206D2AA7|nr:MAG TPA: Protein of unknown function (DUF1398) [Caudoviricetes sp.]
MPYDSAGYRDHCGGCRHFKLDERRTALYREIYGEHMPGVHRCEKLGIRVDRFDSPQNPLSVAAGIAKWQVFMDGDRITHIVNMDNATFVEVVDE